MSSERDFHIDKDREQRQGFPEVIYAEGKSLEQLKNIVQEFKAEGQPVLATRCQSEHMQWIQNFFEDGDFKSDESARAFYWMPENFNFEPIQAKVNIVSAGSSDASVAREAQITLDFFGVQTQLISDVGVAGIHRLLNQKERLRDAQVHIVVAGMDGALPSVVGGLVGTPVIAVPTSVGYGAAFQGVAPLLTMLNSCASGVTVVNIDNGYGAGIAALRILKLN